MHPHQRTGVLVDGVFVIMNVRTIGGSHLVQGRAGFGHDIRDAERTADLHQLPARHDDLFPLGKGFEHDENRGGIVIDHKGGLGSSDITQNLLHM